MPPKYLITSAGLGSRLGAYSKHKNKALITLGTKPAISHIIDKIPFDAEIVLALGYKGDLLRSTISAFHPDRKISFQTIDNYAGVGSGLGYTMRCCEKLLQTPFIFIPNDTIIPESDLAIDPAQVGNWIGIYKKITGDGVDPQQYRCVEKGTNKIHPKGILTEDIYIGLCGVQDFHQFWKAMKNERSIQEGESFGLNQLERRIEIEFKDWFDTGNINSLQKAEKKFASEEHNILPKENEAIWISDKKVLKYHDDERFIEDRLLRVKKSKSSLYPKVHRINKNVYAYDKVQGSVFSKVINIPITNLILDKMQKEIWSKTPNLETNQIKEEKKLIVDNFYREKTFERLQLYSERFEVNHRAKKINGEQCDSLLELVKSISWNKLEKEIQLGHFHGDFHSENIIVDNERENFVLIDWRQNFGANRYEFGDIYYDLAKFQHGLIVSHDMVSREEFKVEDHDEKSCSIDIKQSLIQSESKDFFAAWMSQNNYKIGTVELITALIFINIAPLHHYPYSKFLYYLGQYLLSRRLQK